MENQVRPRLTPEEYLRLTQWRQSGQRVVLCVFDLHAPFVKEGYLEFCIWAYKYYGCTDVVFLGDIIDNHYSSYHESDPDGFGAWEELEKAKQQIRAFHEAFPGAKVCDGNHDVIPNRKAFSAGLSKQWIRSIKEVLDVPTWDFAPEFVIDGVLYNHGIGRKAKQRCQQEMISVVQGHYHSESEYGTFVSENDMWFYMQGGCGIDRKSYAMAYGRHFKKPQLNVGIVFDNGRYGALVPMKLGV